MSSILKSIVRPKSLTHCVLDGSFSGQIKAKLWQMMNAKRVNAKAAMSAITVSDRILVDKIRTDGIAIGNVSNFLDPRGLEALKSSEALIRQRIESDEIKTKLIKGQTEGQHKNYLIHIVDFHESLAADHPLLALALDERLLNIIADYLGMMPQLHAIGSWYNFPVNQEMKASQLWHRDPEDLKTVKAFIYLDDVGPAQGPFTYIPKSQPMGSDCRKQPQHEHPRRVLDHEMETAFPQSQWLSCTGHAGTMILADTVGYHRGGHVMKGHRLLITFTYTSGEPQEKRKLKIEGNVNWTLSPIQNYALMN